MSEKLTDPSKAAHEIVEVRADGDAVRNDRVVLQAANKNPWYVLATIYGEQEEGAEPWVYDKMLARQNRRAWNGWMCENLEPKPNAFSSENASLDTHNPDMVTRKELEKIEKKFQDRMGKDTKLPDPLAAVDLTNLYFSKPFDFSHFIVPRYIAFWKATFTKIVNFEASQFKKGGNFQSAIFNYGPVFHKACFDSAVGFNSVYFGGFTDFQDVGFKDHADFGSATFVGSCEFRTVFEKSVDFSNVRFEQACDFNSVKFKSTTRFTGAQFLTAVPEFHAAEIYDDTLFPTGAGEVGNWPPLSGTVELEGQEDPVEVMGAKDQKRAYNRLRLFMNRSLQIDEEQFFHRMEMRCKRETEGWRYRWIYTLFEGASDYGNSVLRPAGWLFVIWLSGAIAKLEAAKGAWYPDWSSIPQAMGWSFANLFSFFGVYGRYFKGEKLSGVLQVFGGAQTVLGFVLLFMLGLGLRNRFRLR